MYLFLQILRSLKTFKLVRKTKIFNKPGTGEAQHLKEALSARECLKLELARTKLESAWAVSS